MMGRILTVALVLFLAAGCGTGTVVKNFKVFVDPADADIKVLSGTDLKVLKFRSPAQVAVEVSGDQDHARKQVLEITRDGYKPFSVSVAQIKEDQTLNLKLEKIVRNVVRYRLTVRMTSPDPSDSLQYRDKNSAFTFTIGDQLFPMKFENLSSNDVKLLWERAEYTDVNKQPHRIMHSGIRYADRNNPIPDQLVLAHSQVQESVIPIPNVVVNQQKKSYDLKPLFVLDNDSAVTLKGKSFNLFIPVENNRQIIPYNFRFDIVDVVKEVVKE